MAKRLDRTGMRYGHLTVLRLGEEQPNPKDLRWKCICDCGNFHVVTGGALSKGEATWCTGPSCPHGKGPVGTKYGRLLIVKRIGGPSTKYLCLCDCGNSIEVRACNLRPKTKNGEWVGNGTQSCGCLLREVGMALQTKHDLTKKRQGKGKTSKELAAELGVSHGMVIAVEGGYTKFRKKRASAKLFYEDNRVEAPDAKRMVQCAACGEWLWRHPNQLKKYKRSFCSGQHKADYYYRGVRPEQQRDTRPPELNFNEQGKKTFQTRSQREKSELQKSTTAAINEIVKGNK